jgi:hypothetical protein
VYETVYETADWCFFLFSIIDIKILVKLFLIEKSVEFALEEPKFSQFLGYKNREILPGKKKALQPILYHS